MPACILMPFVAAAGQPVVWPLRPGADRQGLFGRAANHAHLVLPSWPGCGLLHLPVWLHRHLWGHGGYPTARQASCSQCHQMLQTPPCVPSLVILVEVQCTILRRKACNLPLCTWTCLCVWKYQSSVYLSKHRISLVEATFPFLSCCNAFSMPNISIPCNYVWLRRVSPANYKLTLGGSPAYVARIFGTAVFSIVNIIFITESLSTLDSTFTSAAKLLGPEFLGILEEGQPAPPQTATKR